MPKTRAVRGSWPGVFGMYQRCVRLLVVRAAADPEWCRLAAYVVAMKE
ncbi:hypothetical protein QP921_07060 [Corynebacterium pseudodiphtheriticum]|nr:hypothetical protein [Corynebacterium pseudodiphtheriticum]MDK8761506.1 hypothetical protein [Corynebacterium pseudodiphtheriticum]